MTPAAATIAWADAVQDGWIHLDRLGRITPVYHRPCCGSAECSLRAKYVDPSGVGWCQAHRYDGMHLHPRWLTSRRAA